MEVGLVKKMSGAERQGITVSWTPEMVELYEADHAAWVMERLRR